MPAYNAARFIRQAIESVLRQEGVDLELIVVDDHSEDATYAIADSFHDPRLTVIHHNRRRGIGACHNTAIRSSRAPYVAHVDADDFLLPGALRKLVDAVAGDPRAGQSHCYFFEVDARGRVSRDAFVRQWHAVRSSCPSTVNHRVALRTTSMANHLRTFRRAVLDELGGFDERLPFGVDYDMALRVVERYGITLVPEFLYARRVHDRNTTLSQRFRRLRRWINNYRIRRRLISSGRVSFLEDADLDVRGFLKDETNKVLAWIRRHVRRAAVIVRWRVWAPMWASVYGSGR